MPRSPSVTGEMARLIQEHDWAATPLGPPQQWPAPLQTLVQTVLASHHPAFIFWGPDHRCLYNDAYSASLGPEQHPGILGRPGREAWADIWPIIGPQVDHVMAGGKATWHENQLIPIARNGRIEPVYWTYSYGPIPLADAPHGVGGVLVMVTETTPLVRAQLDLKAAEARWRRLFEQAPGFVCILEGPQHRFEFANPRCQELVGGRPLLGQTVSEALPETADQGFVQLLDEAYRTGTARTGTAVPLLLRHPGSDALERRFVDFVYQPIRDPNEQVTGIFVQGSDVTERVLASRALADSEARYRALAEQLPGGAVFVVDRDLRYTMAAGEALAMLGLDSTAFVGKTIFEALEPSLASRCEGIYRSALAGHAFEVEHEDQGRAFLTRGIPLRDATGEVYAVLAASWDITRRREDEARLRLALARLDGVLAAAEIGCWTWDLATHRIEHDENLARLYGFGEVRDMSPDQHYERIHPNDHGAMQAAVDQAFQTGVFAIREYRILLPDGGLRWLAGRGRVFHGADGRPERMAGLMIDISELKQLEASLQESDRQKDKFIAILAHELRNPLAPLMSASQLLVEPALDGRRLAWCRDVIQRQVRHMSVLLDDLLNISAINHGRLRIEPQRVALDSVVQSAVEMAEPLMAARQHRLEVTLPRRPVFLMADPGRLAQVLSNLLGNAAKYTANGGQVLLAVEADDRTIRIRVRDSGIGLVATDLPRVFDMFSQVNADTGRSHGGLGIGLALVKGLVELHGGQVSARSDGIGRGSEFTVELPALPPERPALATAGSAPPGEHAGDAAANGSGRSAAAAQGRRILILDDNVDAAATLDALLRMEGHRTLTLNDSREALGAFERFKPEVALLDLGMPFMDGYEVARAVRARPAHDGVRLVAVSGWGLEDHRQRAREAGFDLHFTKPVMPQDILHAVRQDIAWPSRSRDTAREMD